MSSERTADAGACFFVHTPRAQKFPGENRARALASIADTLEFILETKGRQCVCVCVCVNGAVRDLIVRIVSRELCSKKICIAEILGSLLPFRKWPRKGLIVRARGELLQK